jgi:hypothetical protein
LIFFDPDNGIEVKSVPKGRKRSSKYIYWDEIVQAFDTGKSLLIYQHFPYVKRDIFIVGKSDEIKSRTGINRVYSFRTANVVFFLLPSSVERAAFFESQGAIIQEVWGNRIRMGIH